MASTAAEPESRSEQFPRMVYRAGDTARVWNEHDVDYLIVSTMDALRDATADGWFLDPAEATKAGNQGKE